MVLARVALVSAVLGVCSASSGVERDVRQQLEALESLIQNQQARIQFLEKGMAKHEEGVTHGRLDRRLSDLPASIYGTTRVGHVDYTPEASLDGALDSMWMLLCGALVMFMQAGFAMVEAGVCRFKNVQNILLKNLTDVCVGTIGWFIFGWAFAYSGPMTADGYKENNFMGGEEFAGHNFMVDLADGTQEPSMKMVNWFFQWAFCSAATTIVSGGVAERVLFPGYVLFSFLMTSFIYPVVVAWTWGYGWLEEHMGYMDFAGSGIVHMAGGVGALVGAFIAGPRLGRFPGEQQYDFEGKPMSYSRVQLAFDFPESFIPHSAPLSVLGTFILWFGWYGFNCGSTLGLATAERGFMAAQVAMNTTIAAAAGGMTVFFIRFYFTKRYDVGGLCNGVLAGLVSITAPCGNVECGSAFVIGIIGGCLMTGASAVLRLHKIDDPIDAFAVHGACGAWGVIAAGLFDWGKGAETAHGWSGFSCKPDANDDTKCSEGSWAALMGAQFVEVLAIAAWVAIFSTIIFGLLKYLKLLTADEGLQKEGFDPIKHSPLKAYAMEEEVGTSNI